jgi:hypothetical protein
VVSQASSAQMLQEAIHANEATTKMSFPVSSENDVVRSKKERKKSYKIDPYEKKS